MAKKNTKTSKSKTRTPRKKVKAVAHKAISYFVYLGKDEGQVRINEHR